jgi:hypothetical protein
MTLIRKDQGPEDQEFHRGDAEARRDKTKPLKRRGREEAEETRREGGKGLTAD